MTKALLLKRKEDISYNKRKKALRYLLFLKEKSNGTVKARRWVDMRSQREYTTKAETCSIAISLETMMLSCAIDAKEKYVFVTDIPGAFLHAYMEQHAYVTRRYNSRDHQMTRTKAIPKFLYEQTRKPMLYVKLKKQYTEHYRLH